MLGAPPNASKLWSADMQSTARCWTPQQVALAAAMSFLTACAGGNSDTAPSACPPVVEYSRAEQARLADELAALTECAAMAEWLADYAVLRDQARACR